MFIAAVVGWAFALSSFLTMWHAGALFIDVNGLDTCAKAHDVYECEWVAMPKKVVER